MYFAANETSGRSDSTRVILFISGSFGDEGDNVTTIANQLKEDGVQIFGLGAAVRFVLFCTRSIHSIYSFTRIVT